ncbi:MAG: hypothetical protein CMC82_01725 [Flavobacteriaceae bacterium]|nr:hypothetical protein [Flavobacteriaceae bacterium]|tara:strand:- start:527 stop:829 length:303 start_codon:yes stop_codon:yes gene_type:complete
MKKYYQYKRRGHRITIRTFDDLRRDSWLNADSCSSKANVLEALILQATKEYLETMKHIGNDDELENKTELCKSIMDLDKWEKDYLKYGACLIRSFEDDII